MLEAVVRRAGEHKVRTAQLLDASEPLKLRRVDDGNAQWVQLNVAMDLRRDIG
jgi:hypothetical protein